jgi:hypothetical protein
LLAKLAGNGKPYPGLLFSLKNKIDNKKKAPCGAFFINPCLISQGFSA